MLKWRATSSIGRRPLGQPMHDVFPYRMNEIVLARGRTDDLATGAFEHTQQFVVGADHGQPQGFFRIYDAIPFGAELDRTPEDTFVVDTRIWPPMHELHAHRSCSLACDFQSSPNYLGCGLLRIVAQAAKRLIGLAKAETEPLTVRFEHGVDPFIGDPDVAFDVRQGVSQRRRV